MADIVHAGAGDQHGHHEALPQLQHHFDTEAQQFDASKLGMWLFLVTEVLFFSGLFCAYVVYRATHPRIFEVGAEFLSTFWGAFNTVVLILSSFTMALAVWCAQTSRRTGLIVCLCLTWLGAVGFMCVKYVEYAEKIQYGKVWGAGFNPIPHGHHDEHGDAAHAADTAHATDAAHAADTAHATDAADPAHPAQSPADQDGHAPGHAAATPSTPTGTAPATAATTTAAPAAGPSEARLDLPAALEAEQPQIKWAAQGPAGLDFDAVERGIGEHDTPPLTEEAAYSRAQQYRDMQIFFGIYYCMTGLHGIHVIGGMVVIAWLIFGAVRGRYHSEYYTPVDLVGLYWHVVDLVWIFLFPLLYLID